MNVSFYISPWVYSPMMLILLVLLIYGIVYLVNENFLWSVKYDIKQLNKRVDANTKYINELSKKL